MTKRRYNPATRKTFLSRRAFVNKERFGWLKTICGEMWLYQNEDMQFRTGEIGDDIRLGVEDENGNTVNLTLTRMTEDELMKFKDFMDLAFMAAAPIVRRRDQVAQEAADEGDDSYTRVYRQAPVMVVRKGTSGQHFESVSQRPFILPDVDGGSGSSGGAGDEGDAVAELGTQDARAEDHSSQANSYEDIR